VPAWQREGEEKRMNLSISVPQPIKQSFQRLKAIMQRPKRAKTPTILQMEAVECGAAALAIVLAYHGRHVPLEQLRVECGVSRDGSRASSIVKTARQYGLWAKGYRYPPQLLLSQPVPMIVHWNFNHFLVVEGFGKDKIYLNDPAVGPYTVSYEEFDHSFTGIVMVFKKEDDFIKGGEKKNMFADFRQWLHGSEGALAYIFLASLALVILGLVIPVFSRVFVDYYLVGNMQQWVAPLLGGMVITAVFRSAFTWLQQRFLMRLETKLTMGSSSRLWWHILRLPMEFFAQRGAGDVSSRVDMNAQIARLLSGDLATAALNTLLIVFYALLMFRYSVLLTVIGIVMATLNFVAMRWVSRKRVDANQKLIREKSRLLSTAFNGLQNIETIKATGSESDFFSRWSGYQTKVVNASQELGASTQIVAVVPTFLTMLTNILILTVGGVQVMDGSMSLGMLVAFQSLMTSFLMPVNQIVNLGSQMQEIEGTMRRLADVTEYKPDGNVEIVKSFVEEAAESSKLTGAIELENVSFGYNPTANPLIENFSLNVAPGSRIALVGGSGSGKSTIAKLIAGLYTPWSGEIRFDGRAYAEIPRVILNNSMSMVDQEIFLFEGTVRENLTMWDEHIPDDQVVQAGKDAQIHDDIVIRSKGYDYKVEESGRNFSGGQRQRLEIARALVENPTILVLDEATSALDPVTEKRIDDSIRRRGCTAVIVAHRLSTIRDCDEIIVLEKGQIVQRGTHDALWRQRDGAYSKLIRAESTDSEMLVDSLLEALYV
jgi:NHLM bacteriocin system ABC transporter peptidase/ATP-binding protein